MQEARPSLVIEQLQLAINFDPLRREGPMKVEGVLFADIGLLERNQME